MTFGLYPDVSLSEARELRDQARRQKNKGSDPMAERKTAKLVKRVAAENSFATVGRAWFEQWRGVQSATHWHLHGWQSVLGQAVRLAGGARQRQRCQVGAQHRAGLL